MVAAAIDIVCTYADVPAKLARLADILFIIAAALQAAIWAREIILGVIRSRVGDDRGSSTLGNAMALIRVLVSVALFAIAIIVILDNLGVNVTALVAGLGIGGIAIGLAAQGIFSDLFAALAIVFDRPFRRGDTIRYGDRPPARSSGSASRRPACAASPRRAGHHGQHQVARAGSAQPRRGQGAAHLPAVQPDLPHAGRYARRAARNRRSRR